MALEAVPLHGRLGETLGDDAAPKLRSARFRVFCKAYGVSADTVLRHIPTYLQMVIDDVRELAIAGAEPFASFARGGVPEMLEADLVYCHRTWL